MSSGVEGPKRPEGKPPQEVKSKTDEQARAEKFRQMMRVEAVDPEQKRRGTKQGEEEAKKEENEAAAGEGEVHRAEQPQRQQEKTDVAPFPALFADTAPGPVPGPMMGSMAPSAEEGVSGVKGAVTPSPVTEVTDMKGAVAPTQTPQQATPHSQEAHYIPPPLTPPSTQSSQTQQETTSEEESSDAALETEREAAALEESARRARRPPPQPKGSEQGKAAAQKEIASEKKKETATPPLSKKLQPPTKPEDLAKKSPAAAPSKPVEAAPKAPSPTRQPPKEELPTPPSSSKQQAATPLSTAALSPATPILETAEETKPHEAIAPPQPIQEKESLPSRVEKKETGKEKEATLPAGPSTATPLIAGLHDAAAPPTHAPAEAPSGAPSPFSTAYSRLHPEVLDVLDRLVGQIQVSLANGLQETRVTYSSRIPSSVFNGSQIIVRRYASAADEFNVTIVADPRAAERLRAQLPDLRAALVDPRFKVQRLEVVLPTETAEKGEFQRKEPLSGQEGESDTEGESR